MDNSTTSGDDDIDLKSNNTQAVSKMMISVCNFDTFFDDLE